MADLGSIAVNGTPTKEKIIFAGWVNSGAIYDRIGMNSIGYAPAFRLHGPVIGVEPYVLTIGGTGSNSTEGTVTPPSLKMDAAGIFRFRWSVINGNRSIEVFVKQPLNGLPRPLLRVKANPAIGVMFDGTSVASSGTDWVSTGTVAIAPTTNGAVWVQLENRLDAQTSPCYWDRIVTT